MLKFKFGEGSACSMYKTAIPNNHEGVTELYATRFYRSSCNLARAVHALALVHDSIHSFHKIWRGHSTDCPGQIVATDSCLDERIGDPIIHWQVSNLCR